MTQEISIWFTEQESITERRRLAKIKNTILPDNPSNKITWLLPLQLDCLEMDSEDIDSESFLARYITVSQTSPEFEDSVLGENPVLAKLSIQNENDLKTLPVFADSNFDSILGIPLFNKARLGSPLGRCFNFWADSNYFQFGFKIPKNIDLNKGSFKNTNAYIECIQKKILVEIYCIIDCFNFALEEGSQIGTIEIKGLCF